MGRGLDRLSMYKSVEIGMLPSDHQYKMERTMEGTSAILFLAFLQGKIHHNWFTSDSNCVRIEPQKSVKNLKYHICEKPLRDTPVSVTLKWTSSSDIEPACSHVCSLPQVFWPLALWRSCPLSTPPELGTQWPWLCLLRPLWVVEAGQWETRSSSPGWGTSWQCSLVTTAGHQST